MIIIKIQRKHVFANYFMYSKLFQNRVSKCRTCVAYSPTKKTRHYYSLTNQYMYGGCMETVILWFR